MFWSKKGPLLFTTARGERLVSTLNASCLRAEVIGLKTARDHLWMIPTRNCCCSFPANIAHSPLGELARPVPSVVAPGLFEFPHQALGTSHEWQIGRHTLIAEVALNPVFEKIGEPLAHESDLIVSGTAGVLSHPRKVTRVGIFSRADEKLPLKEPRTARSRSRPIAPTPLLTGKPAAINKAADWVVPLRPNSGGARNGRCH